MLRWAVIFLVIALVAALFGFTGIAAGRGGNREVSLPRDLPDFFNHRHLSR